MFQKLQGNEQVKVRIRRLLEADRLPNALLFAGPEGVGKRLFALELAKSFICVSPDIKPCGRCGPCMRADVFEFPKADEKDAHKKVIFSRHTDIGTVIAYKRLILVDSIRDLEQEAHFRPYEAPARFFIVDQADKMNEAASNALLKTLEEPPSTSYVFLISSRPDALLPTIRSRCQIIRFSPINTSQIEEFLSSTNKLLPDDVAIAARLAGGSIGAALAVDVQKYRDARAVMLDVLESVLAGSDRSGLLFIAEAMNDAKGRDDFESNLDILKILIHDVWLHRNGRCEAIVNVDVEQKIGQFAKAADTGRLVEWITRIEELQTDLAINVNRKLATDSLFVQMAA